MLFDQLRDLLHQRIEARAFFVDDRRAAYQRHESAVGIFNANSGGAFAAFDHNFDLAVLLLLRLQDAAERADAVNLLGRRLVDGGIVLGGQERSCDQPPAPAPARAPTRAGQF